MSRDAITVLQASN